MSAIADALDEYRELIVDMSMSLRERQTHQDKLAKAETELAVLEAVAKKVQTQLDPFRYFLDQDGFRWKVPRNGEQGYGLCVGSEDWAPCGIQIENLLGSSDFYYERTVETDEHGVPLEPKKEGA